MFKSGSDLWLLGCQDVGTSGCRGVGVSGVSCWLGECLVALFALMPSFFL